MKTLTNEKMEKGNNPSLLKYRRIYKNIEQSTISQIESFGLPFEENNEYARENQLEELRDYGAVFRNNEKSFLSNERISSACEACQTGSGSYTSFVSLKCHRDCYFCFNKNQDNYQFYLQNQKNVNQELQSLFDQKVKLTHLALTGGEPLLHPNEALAFFQLAKKLFPEVHTRLYTAGDLLTDSILEGLKAAGLQEIRFSIKLEDSSQKRKHILGKIAAARSYIPDVLVEMPVIPGTEEEMKKLLLELEELDIYGINLLEFCFPLENTEAFQEKGFQLKNPPYDVYYNFWYAGGLAVAESERLCLELVRYAREKNLQLGVHYCSLENKFTGQIYQQNHDQKLDDTYHFSTNDYYFKTAKVFGSDKRKVMKVLDRKGFRYVQNTDYDYLQFPIKAIPHLGEKDVDILISSNVVEVDRGKQSIREVHLDRTTATEFKLESM
ncbi:radical SAM protein [Neobacillus niacini]|uniref:radical SAM protein n=1 Tax=Neobacillus niacini TaxID=86668 RepID=UPI002041A2CA|nr:radical SAM protein [Neobacillus niacini]MCM3691871.1 radical SAM protein [Neobacillus niacini]